MYRRNLEPFIRRALQDTPVVLIEGARQTGKSTLVKEIAGDRAYISLDDIGILQQAKQDPMGFVAQLEDFIVLDEVQRTPELFPAIKLSADRDRRPGRFLLTGSANVLLLPRLSESLVGRIEIHALWPLSQSEIERNAGGVVDRMFSGRKPPLRANPTTRREAAARIYRGGFPEPLMRKDAERRRNWYSSYVTALLTRDVRELAAVEGLTAFPRLLSILAARTAGLLNLSDIARDSGIAYATLNRYMALLRATYTAYLIPAWSANLGQRLVKSPKVLLCDSGLAASLLGLNEDGVFDQDRVFGSLLESFIALELIKDSSVSQTRPNLFHFRTSSRTEVDLVLENASGRIFGIEVKATATPTASDFKGLKALEGLAKDRFIGGWLFYLGEHPIPFGPNLMAVPLAELWAGAE